MKIRKRIITTALLLMFFSLSHFALALTVSPVKLDLSGDPGQTISGEIELYNEQSESKTFYASYENFEPSGNSGSPHFVGGGKGLATWITTEQSVVLDPNERKNVPFTITIPEDTEPGGYFSGIFFGGQNPANQGSGEVAIGGKLGVLLLLRVEGDIEESAGLSAFSTQGGARFFKQLPVTFSYKMNNKGADRIVPLGEITITNTFGMKSEVLPANKNEGSVLPESTRLYESAWNAEGVLSETAGFFETVQYQFRNLHVGWYTAKLQVTWGMENNVSTARHDFFFLPWQLMLVTFIVVFGALVGLKQYNKWIVGRARKS